MIEKKRIVICAIIILISFLSGVSISYFATVRHNRIGSERIREELNRANESYAKLEFLHERIRDELRESHTRITSLETELEIARRKLNDVRGATEGLEESIRGNIDSITNIREAIGSLREITQRLESYFDSVGGIIGD